MNNRLLIPLDFNSLCNLKENKLELSNYYINYAFKQEDITPINGKKITFYDKYWMSDPDEIVCLDAVLTMNKNSNELWVAEVVGRVYLSREKPKRKYFSSFIGSNTSSTLPNVRTEITPGDEKLNGISAFVFAPGSELPNFSSIIGMNTVELNHFFQFSAKLNIKKPLKSPDGRLSDENLVVRGGGNINETYRKVQ